MNEHGGPVTEVRAYGLTMPVLDSNTRGIKRRHDDSHSLIHGGTQRYLINPAAQFSTTCTGSDVCSAGMGSRNRRPSAATSNCVVLTGASDNT